MIKIKGKFRKDFTKYLMDKHGLTIFVFEKMHFSFCYGVYVDFGDSVGYRIGVFPIILRGKIEHELFINESYKGEYNSRHEAREQAVLKLMEIYNENKESNY